MKIRSLHLNKIGVFENETISFPEKRDKDLAEIHILTGQNGTGKTTILQALASGMYQIEPFDAFGQFPNQGLNDFIKRFKEGQKSSAKIELGDGRQIYVRKESASYESVVGLKIATRMPEDKYNFCAFAYSNNRKIDHEENINIQNKNFDPLLNALNFLDKTQLSIDPLNQWLANTISKRGFARDEGDENKAKKIDTNIQNIQFLIEEIIGKKIKFEPVYETGIKIVANIDGNKLDFDLLPDGLRSLIFWVGDLLMRMDALKWENDLPVFEREFILFLDEIEVHLHPSWQRKILPVVQKLFKNAQIFITTHSPFIVNSVDGAYIYELKLNDKGNCYAEQPPHVSSTAMPIDEVLEEIYNLEATQMYGEKTRKEIEGFQNLVQKAYQQQNGFTKEELLKNASKLALESTELRNRVQFELRQLSKNLGEEFAI